MFTLVDLICKNPDCSITRYEDLLTKDEIRDGMKCPKCGKSLEIDMTNRPRHQRHVSWTTWRIGHGE